MNLLPSTVAIGRQFEQWAAATPAKPAIVSPDASISYDELNRRVNRLVAALRHRVSRAETVATLLGSDANQVVAFLATIKLGRRFVPIDPRFPDERIRLLLDDVGAGLVVTDARHRAVAATSAPDTPVLALDALDDHLTVENPDELVPPGADLWVVYTSGTTGAPKGILQTHRNLLHYLELYRQGLRLTPADRVTTLFPFTVNGGLHDVLLTLVHGGTLCAWNAKAWGFAGLAGWLSSQQTTIYSSVPTAFRQFALSLKGHERFSALRLIRVWGEPSYRRDFVAFQNFAPDHCLLMNRLGASETGPVCWQCFDKRSTFDGNNLPAGTCTEGHEILLLDQHGDEVSTGDSGEVVVRSGFLSPGYWRREELTRAVFERDPSDPELRRYHTGDMARRLADGTIVPLGRKDHQIKIRGYRIELDEIEQALAAVPGLDDVVVVPQHDERDEPRLVAYFVGSSPGPTVSALRRTLASRLPEYMIPAAFVRLDAFPIAPNGKVARRQLPPPSRQRPALEATYTPPVTAVQQWLVRTLEDVLRLDQVGIDDPFLELGGDSLLATQIAVRASEQFHHDVPMRLFFEHGTVAELATAIEALESSGALPQRPAIRRAPR